MASAELKVGDVVKLKKGDQKMTVNQIIGPIIACEWFDEADVLHSRQFDVLLLELCLNA